MSTTSIAIFSNPLFATYSVHARNASINTHSHCLVTTIVTMYNIHSVTQFTQTRTHRHYIAIQLPTTAIWLVQCYYTIGLASGEAVGLLTFSLQQFQRFFSPGGDQ